MSEIKTIEIKKSVFSDNTKIANELRENLSEKGIFLLNLMSSPGSGKTTTLINLINRLKDKIKIAVMEADVDSNVDAEKIQNATGIQTLQIHTGGLCHMDASMVKQGIENLDLSNIDLCILENVGNLVCPAEFDTGASLNIMLLSVPEGDDKPIKYPLMFSTVDLVVVNKIDVLKLFNFDIKRFEENVKSRNPNAKIMQISAKTGFGVQNLADFILDFTLKFKNQH